ncbi:ras small gtpase ric1, putative [Ichthyophthirius multifiliis]|uniref:Ras small gtpase ric1, putative n=1 Tax=Ichthyophthirius multifiliis TaxID=5932 RepID=G0QL40_ICHMU|nr:ras small gtpase ric1, putative [Ichthyophthirius multifiliis]EGR34065.1 ras small gtpase ric1, putative [Ichthyophthirius multifiliis]|eukprot:XP_004039369.1 ras small gtpase ric1, putative [Ichthyophthirius multifiliis]
MIISLNQFQQEILVQESLVCQCVMQKIHLQIIFITQLELILKLKRLHIKESRLNYKYGILQDKIDLKQLHAIIIGKNLQFFNKKLNKRGAHGIVVVYDVTDKQSFENVKSWMSEIEKYAQENVNKLLIGNKSDLQEKRQVSFDEGQQLAQSLGIKFIETSAKNSTNIDSCFEIMAKDILLRINMIKSQQDNTKVKIKPGNNINQQNNNNSACC